MKKALILSAIMLASLTSVAHGKYLCSYTTFIDNDNKYNSSGQPLAKSVSKASAAAILQQDRADVHRFGNDTDQKDCYFNTTAKRQKMASMLNKGSISKQLIHDIVRGNPQVAVNIYTTHIDVYYADTNAGE